MLSEAQEVRQTSDRVLLFTKERKAEDFKIRCHFSSSVCSNWEDLDLDTAIVRFPSMYNDGTPRIPVRINLGIFSKQSNKFDQIAIIAHHLCISVPFAISISHKWLWPLPLISCCQYFLKKLFWRQHLAYSLHWMNIQNFSVFKFFSLTIYVDLSSFILINKSQKVCRLIFIITFHSILFLGQLETSETHWLERTAIEDRAYYLHYVAVLWVAQIGACRICSFALWNIICFQLCYYFYSYLALGSKLCSYLNTLLLVFHVVRFS